VNELLLAALREGVLHQVDEPRARSVLRAIDAFERDEARRWDQVRSGTLPPHVPSESDQLDELMQDGYDLLQSHQTTAACDRWLAAWEIVKHLARPEMKTVDAFDQAYPDLEQSVFNWSSDLEMELGNAGLDDSVYHERRLQYSREFLAQFPDEDANRYVNMLRAQGEALWHLGRSAEAEAVYAALAERLPDEGWAYIGWADNYWLLDDSPKEYATAEAILQRALARPALRDRGDVLERLEELQKQRDARERRL
jgi:tetratricopeptide (TPR) repeat protein